MNEPNAQRRNIAVTVFALVGIMLLIVSLFVRQYINPARIDPEWLAIRNTVLFDVPRRFDAPRLVDQRGQAFDAKTFAGAWSVLFFGFTFCPDICPTTLTLLRDIESELKPVTSGRLPVGIYMVSVDPVRDTPAQLRPYIEHFSPHFTALTGEFLDVLRFATQLNIPFRKSVAADGNYSVDHSANLVLLNSHGDYAGYVTAPIDKQRLLQVLEVLRRRTD